MASLDRVGMHISSEVIEEISQGANVVLEQQENGEYHLATAGCGNHLCRALIPNYAVDTDKEVLRLFQEIVHEQVQSSQQIDPDSNLIRAAQSLSYAYSRQYPCNHYKPDLAKKDLPHMTALLERYVHAVQRQHQEGNEPLENYQVPANIASLNKWTGKGLPEELFHRYPDFVDFILSNNLHNMLEYYVQHPSLNDSVVHGLFMDEESGEPKLLVNGRVEKWNDFADQLTDENGKLNGWFYSQDNGLIEYDLNGWATLQDCLPIRTLPLDQRPPTPVFSVVSAIKKYPSGPLKDIHTSFRLTFPDGREYSFGLWSDPKIEAGGASTACEIGRGMFICPDPFEFLGDNVELVVTPFAITEEKMGEVVQKIEKAKADGVPFQWWEYNCTAFVCEILRVIDVNPGEPQTLFNLLPQNLQNGWNCVWDSIPRIIQIPIEIVFAVMCVVKNIFVNTMYVLFMGAAKGSTFRVRNADGEESDQTIVMIGSLWDFFFKGMTGRVPSKLLDFQRSVALLRSDELSRLNTELALLEEQEGLSLSTGESERGEEDRENSVVLNDSEDHPSLSVRIDAIKQQIQRVNFGIPGQFSVAVH